MSEVSNDLLSISTAYVALPPEKRAVFRGRLRERGIDAARLPIVPFPGAERRFPLSHAQERLWFLWRLDPASAAYNVTGAMRLRGRLDAPALRAALDRVVDAHESLRQRFDEVDGVPYQSAGPRDYGWQTLALDAAEDGALDALLAERSAAPFDLEHGPLLRVALIALAPDDHVLHVALHHIVSDGLSVGVLVNELGAAYAACLGEDAEAPATGARAASAPAGVQYGDYALWQREWLDDGALARQLDYWRNRLGTDHPVLELPKTRTRTGMRSGAGGRVVRVLPPALHAALLRVSNAADATPFMTLLAAYDLLLARYSGQRDIRVGVPAAGRDRPEVARTIGFFVNTLVIRSELDAVPTFEALLAQVRERVLEAHAHADLPFTKLVDALQPQRSFGNTPLFQAMFNYLGNDDDTIRLPGLDVSNHEIDMQTARFDLVLDARERANGFEVAFTYAEDLFDAATMGAMLDHFVALLDAALGAPQRPLAALAAAAPGPAPAPVKPYRSVPARFAASAARHAASLAAHCEGQHATYAQLDRHAERVARALAAAGVRHDERVGICMTRSLGMVAALLGTLRSPGAFVPLDPAYPAERLAMMMDDAGVKVVLTDAAARRQCGGLFAGRAAIDVDALEGEGEGDANAIATFVHEPHPDQLAYVIYTSGSTGRPKGVAISHGAFAAHLDDFITAHGIGADDTQLQSSTINFDVALHEMLPALLQGGRIEMRGAEPWDIDTTSRHLIDARVTFSRLPTAYWQQWLRTPPPPQALAALRQITVGGEGLPGDALAQWQRGPLGRIGLANLYGPTETTVACMYRATTPEDAAQSIVSIGVPYASRTARVLDRDGNEAPVGALGELCIGGHTLARGYLDRAAQTAERFVPDPLGAPGSRLYRTGDLCRRRADGAIDFLGRLDQQIKLRGFRIEPGEIEAALRRQPGVAEAVVVLASERGVARLVGYVVGAAGTTLDGAELQRSLARQLPAHMVPAALAVLERMPLMQNGKVDRAALPAVEVAAADGPRAAPRNDAERALLAWWGAVLNRDDLGIDDDFFSAGGDSILSLQLIARARAQGWLLTPRQVFEQPTVARLAAVMRPLETAEAAAELRDPLPLTPIQAWFHSRYPEGQPHWNQSVLLRVRGRLDGAAFERALGAVIARHDALRLRFERDPADGAWRQRVLAEAPAVAVASIDLREAGGRWPAALEDAAERAQRALDPASGRLVHAVAWRTPDLADGSPDGRLLLVIHHLAVDGVSWRILLADLAAAYAAATEGRAIVLDAALPWSVWAAAQRDAATPARLAAALPAWQAALAGAVVPLDAPASSAATSDVVDWKLEREATDALRRAAPRAYRLGIDELLLAALARAMAATFGGDGALIALEGHGRDIHDRHDLDPSRTVGWFTTRYPAWLPAPADDAAALIDAKARLRALPDGGASWGWLQAYGDAAAHAALAALPVPRVSFNYLGQFDGSLADDGPFGFATEPSGAQQPADEALAYAVDINGMIVDGRLSFAWRFDPARVSPERQHALVAAFDREVARFVAHCEQAAPRATAADFPRAAISEADFDALGLAAVALDDLYPATPLQQGLLFHSLLERGAYLNRKRLTLRGEVDIDAMRRAWQTVIARHPVLRTRFVRAHGGTMLQAVHAAVPLPFEVHDWRERDDYETAFASWFDEAAPKRIDLDAASLMHVALFRRPDGAHDLAWFNHHALSDGWSQSQLLGELTRAYVAARAGGEAVLDPVVPFSRYTDWLAAQPDTGDWWRAQLARVDQPALLLDAVPSPAAAAVQAERGGDTFRHRAAPLGAALSAALADTARRRGVTLNTLIQAAWALVLARHDDRRQAAFGVTVSGRPSDLAGAGAIQGVFINSLPLWVDVPADAPLQDWLLALQHRNVELRQVEHTPLTSIQQWAGAQVGTLFDSLLVFENYPIDPALKDGSLGLTVEASVSFERTHYPLTLGVLPGERIGLEWSWDASRLDEATLDALAAAYEAMLAQLARPEATTLAALRASGPAGVAGAAVAEPHPYRPVAARFEAAVREHGDALALRCGDASLGYTALDRAANRIARRLADAGVRAGAPVGVCMERSPALIAALFGVLKAGGAYVPLDPAYPRERLRDMCGDARIAIVLTDAATAADHADWIAAEGRVALDAAEVIEAGDAAAEAACGASAEPHPEQLAYLIYTSGSTGRPKGVALTHGALSRHLDDFIADHGLRADDHVLQFSTVNFDASVEQIFAPLTLGASLEMRGTTLWSADEFDRVLTGRAVTFAYLPTGYWKQWVRQARPRPGFVLRRMLIGGEALPGTAVAQWFDSPLREVPLFNTYGPTEIAVTSSVQRVEPAQAGCLAAPIGRPSASRVYRILDRDGLPVPAHGVGELCIGGTTLARAYAGRPELSAERFVPDPLGAPGARLYRTGDRCRWLPDGSVAYLGRLDEQVKVRGFRIEPGEIEAALLARPEVAEAVVVAQGDGDARRVVAYVVGRIGAAGEVGAAPDAAALRAALAERLPAHMVPAAIGVLDALPTLPNGKLDRRALPALDADSATGYVAPATPLEATVAEIWQAVLGIERIGARDDFFALGGHSLLALQVAARLQRALGREVPLRALFDHPELAALAAWLEAGAAPGARVLPPVRASGLREAPPTHGQTRLWFLWRFAPDNPAYHLSLAVRIDGALDASRLHAALEAVVARHQMLHSRFDERDGAPWLVVDETLRAGWDEAAFASADDAACLAWLRECGARPFDLLRGPLLRARLARVGADAHLFQLTLHHVAADGWSMNLLIDELAAAYEAALAGDARAYAPALPVQYVDYALWQHASLDAAALDAQLDYWRDTLGDEQPVLELPADRPRPAVRDGQGGQVGMELDRALADALQTYARRHDATLFMTLLAAFHALLHRYGGQRDVRIGIPLGGRERIEIEPLIGFFVNTAVIRAELSGALPFDALLAQVRQRVLDAQANQDVPFARLVDALQPVRVASHTPLFQAMFNYDVRQGASERRIGEALRLSPFGAARTAAQFDLTLGVSVGERIGLSFGYATDLFDRDTVVRLLDDYRALLAQIVGGAAAGASVDKSAGALAGTLPEAGEAPDARPAPRLRDFKLEARAVASRGAFGNPPFVAIHERIAAQARRTPDAIAVRCDGVLHSYRELDARATRVARQLLASGIGAEARVGVCTARSGAMLVAVLAALKAGAAYVPLDPAYPDAHLGGMIEDAGLACTLADAAGRERLGALGAFGALGDAHRLIDPDDTAAPDAADAADPASDADLPAVDPAQLAYVIYTSGSTGRPKGVGVTHGALARFLESLRARLAPTPDDVWLAVTTLSFDIAALELYLPLAAGATIELATRETVVDGTRLAALAESSGATLMQATPMGWRVLLDGGWQGRRGRFTALCGGEALPPDLADALQARGVALWNLYGPTETTIWSSAARLDAGARITLGAPLEHTTLQVLDESGQPVPDNGVGELCIGGANLARGYLGRAGQTAERFIPDPHGAPGARLYRTGDLCRVRRDGRLEYLGRADQQVKLRGFRIELGATEAALRALDGVRDAACRIVGDGSARRLVAYVTGEADPAGLRARLAEQLPMQQVPAQVVRLDALPLTSNGKLNRNALPEVAAHDDEHYVAPRTPTEVQVCETWAEVLGIARAGRDDDFFVLGGHSLAAVRVAARLGERLGRKVELALLFSQPRAADLAARLDGEAGAGESGGEGGGGSLDAMQGLLDSL